MMKCAQPMGLWRETVAELAAAEGADAAFVAGSRVVGLGNTSSDVDVYLVGPDLRESRRQLFVEGTRVDVKTLATEWLTSLVGRVLADYPAPDGSRVTDADLTIAVRLLTADIVTDTGCLTNQQQRLRASPLPLRRRIISSWTRIAYSAVEDVAGFRHSADRLDLDAAITAGRRALLAAGKALAAGCGDLHQGDKWVWHQLARSAPVGFPLAEYRRLMHHDTSEGLGELISLVQTSVVAAMTLGWWDVPLAHWPVWTDCGGPLRRAAYSLPCASDRETLIVVPGARVFRVPGETLLIWGLCHGSSPDRVADAAAALGPLVKPWNTVTTRRCHAVLKELADAALITGAHRED
ncbi:hypothetical protein [Actinophytocola glycyrrhizae]|uniref:Nucleotidyltransferase-like protein n=1 Tax=Actinophytocola glycyrrhizae TaxID=2044873 RepID=A0ABV9S6H9_9PSEU